LKNLAKKFWHYILIALCAAIAGGNYLVNDVKPDFKAVTSGDLSTIGQQAEDAETK
jgi:hypothetical protein